MVVWTDADMTYPNELIPELVAELDDTYDQVVGARRSEAGTYKLARVPAKWAIRKLASYLTNTDIPDLNSGLRAFKRRRRALSAVAGRVLVCDHHHPGVFVQWASGQVRAHRLLQAGRAVQVPPSPTPTTTSSRCYGW